MGNLCSCCKSDKNTKQDYPWEEKLVEETIMKSGLIDKVAILGFNDYVVRAHAPRNFIPDKDGVVDIIKAFKGDTGPIAEKGIVLGNGVPTNVPGKMDEGKAIYCNDGKGGGVNIFKTKECLLITVYKKDVASATRLALEISEHMEENGR